MRAEDPVGVASEQLELRKVVAAGEGYGREWDETLVIRPGPLYRRAPIGSTRYRVRGNEPGQGSWELAAARVFPLGFGPSGKTQPEPAGRPRPGASRARAGGRAARLGGGGARVWLPGSPPQLDYWSIPKLTI